MASTGFPSKQFRSPPLAKSEDSATSNTENSSICETPYVAGCENVSTALISHPVLSRSQSDRRLKNNRAPLEGSKAGMTSNAAGPTSTPDIDRYQNRAQTKKPLHSSFKFIDDYSPLATRKIVANREDGRNEKIVSPVENAVGFQHDASAVGQEQSSRHIRRISVRPSVDSVGHSLEVQCGIGPYRPSCLQKFANKSWMLFWLCWFCAVQGMLVSGLVPSILSTIERRFNFRAASLGRIMQWYDIGYALCCVPVSYFGGRHSKPVFIGIGLLIMGAGSFIFSLPHIISNAHIYRETTENIGHCSNAKTLKPEMGTLPFVSLLFDQRDANAYHDGGSTNETIVRGCDMLRKQNDHFFSGILIGSFRFEVLFCFAHLLHGIGATPLFTLGVSYIDENVKPTLSSLYIAIFYTFVIIGPAAGFLMSGAFLRYHTDFLSTERQTDIMEIDESDQEWVGAWWIGFQIASILSLFAVFPILSFPKTLPGALEWQRSRMHRNAHASNENDERHGDARRSSKSVVVSRHQASATVYGVSSNDPCTSSPPQLPPAASAFMVEDATGAEAKHVPLMHRLIMDLRHMPSAVRRLVTNPAYMCITLAASVEGLLIAGLSGFMAKYLERQFNVASSRANMLIGCIMVPAAGMGTLASGYIVKRLRLTCPQTMRYCIVMAVCSLALSPMFLVLCDPAKLSGVQVPYPSDIEGNRNSTAGKDTFYLKSQCNSQCTCFEDEFRPVCGTLNQQQTTFFSSCYAGCPEKYHRSIKAYYNCSCADGNKVTAGWCESKCSALIGFLILFAPMCLSTFSIGVPALSVVLRCVDYNERSFALGIQWILIRCIGCTAYVTVGIRGSVVFFCSLLQAYGGRSRKQMEGSIRNGTIPAPAIFAWLFDISCLKRRKATNECGSGVTGDELDGSCYIYDNKLLADLFLAFALIGQTVTLIFLIMASLCYRNSGSDDLIISEAPPPPAAVIMAPGEDGYSRGGTPTRAALEAARKNSVAAKSLV